MFPHSSSEELKKSPFDKGDGEPANLGDTFSSHRHSEATAEESFLPCEGEAAKPEGVINTTPHPEQSEDPKSPPSVRGEPRLVGEGGFNSQQPLNQEQKNENDEDLKNRAKIFRTF